MAAQEDPRDDVIQQEDILKVKEQIERITDAERSRTFQRELFSQIQRIRRLRREEPRSDDGEVAFNQVTYDVGTLEQGPGFLVAVTGEILVRSEAEAEVEAVLGPAGFTADKISEVPELRDRVTRFVKDGTTVQATNALARRLRSAGISASLNYVVPLGYVAKGEGGFEPTTVKKSHRGPGKEANRAVRVAVVDTGIAHEGRHDGWLENIETAHEHIDPLYVPGAGDLLDFSAGHGTFVAGVIQQIAPNADIQVYKAIQSDGIGSEIEIASAILRAGNGGSQVINLSLGTPTADDAPPVALQVALELLAEDHPDVLVVAAAGNSESTRPSWPAAFRSVVSVASLTSDLKPSTWSNHGPWVDCSAVGEGVVSTYVRGQESAEVDKDHPDKFDASSWAIGTGTSFAAPQIAGQIVKLLDDGSSADPRAALKEILSRASGAISIPSYGMGVKILPGTANG